MLKFRSSSAHQLQGQNSCTHVKQTHKGSRTPIFEKTTCNSGFKVLIVGSAFKYKEPPQQPFDHLPLSLLNNQQWISDTCNLTMLERHTKHFYPNFVIWANLIAANSKWSEAPMVDVVEVKEIPLHDHDFFRPQCNALKPES
ncbi:hypothetical protein QVD17_09079 [Tagetes erecta]|uniref:Uncharacterized protein n=1 Tax=Tagetes erecta TaxID=13708 RepID=A0AAD8KZW0_TARER|nr:hypothetical protein QVD17_09079 [Tagetes erecta]